MSSHSFPSKRRCNSERRGQQFNQREFQMLPEKVTFNPRKAVAQIFSSPFGALIGFGLVWVSIEYLTKDNAPAWVQAVGAVGAIWAPASAARRQQREQIRNKEEKDRVIIVSIAEIARSTSMAVDRLFELASTGQVRDKMSEFVSWIEYVERQTMTIKGIELVSLPKAEMIQPFLLLIHNMESAARQSRAYIAGAKGEELRSIGISMRFNKEIIRSSATTFAEY